MSLAAEGDMPTATEIQRQLDVSRETAEDLLNYAALLERWNKSINMIGRSSVPQMWTRHILDSAQILNLAPPNSSHWLDIGSGGGLPGLVCAILSKDARPTLSFTLVESDKRKCAFLTTAIRQLELTAVIKAKRIESLPPQQADIISARALAPLSTLFSWIVTHVTPGAVLLLPKGATYMQEVAEAERSWSFTHRAHRSITHPDAFILACDVPSPRTKA